MAEIFGRLTKKKKEHRGAKDRLQFVLIHDRRQISPVVLEKIKNEILNGIAKHVALDIEGLDIEVTSVGEEGEYASALIATIPLQHE